MIFLGLVVLWLLILVPAVARHRQEVARPSTSALSGRVLDRSRRGPDREQGRRGPNRPLRMGPPEAADEEVDVTEHDEPPRSVTVAEDERANWERPAPRYRRGRGGFDPEAAALTARARYATRQRVVLVMLVLVVGTALAGGFLAGWVWWLHVLVDLTLVGYLVYLRRQVRLEEAIRARRAARAAGTRRVSAADDPALDEWARRGRAASERSHHDDDADEDDDEDAESDDRADDLLTREEPERVAGTGAPIWRGPGPGLDMMEVEAALPRLQPEPPPPLPAGTALVETDLDDPELHDLDEPMRPDYRRAAGE
jgi:hypothetical protein